MTRRARVVMVVWVVMLALPSLALADRGGGPAMGMDLRSHDGYQVRLYGFKSTATLTVTKRENAGYAESTTEYLSRAVVKGDVIKADFGDLGEVSMRFVPSGAWPSTGCDESRPALVQRGSFVGSMRFRGESGYVKVDVRRAAGALMTPAGNTHCEEPQAEHRHASHRRKLTSFYAGLRHGIDSAEFWAETNESGRVEYGAVDESGGEGMATYRRAWVEGPPLTFATDPALSFLSVSPPYPFSGTGLVQRNPNGSRTWSGTLGVSFPGVPEFALTGPEFRTFLTRQW